MIAIEPGQVWISRMYKPNNKRRVVIVARADLNVNDSYYSEGMVELKPAWCGQGNWSSISAFSLRKSYIIHESELPRVGYRPDEVASMFGMPTDVVDEWIDQKVLSSFRFGGYVFVRPESILTIPDRDGEA